MAIFHAYFDESGKHKDHPVVTFAGVCAPQSKIPQFDDAWRGILRHYGLPSLHMLKLSRLSQKVGKIPPQQASERIECLRPFADCINQHLELGLIQAWDVGGFQSLSRGARAALGSPDDPYYVAFTRGLIELVDYIQPDDRIALFCDDDLQTAWDCYRHYRGVKKVDGKGRKLAVLLSFADDEYFPALQAADMVAYLARHEAKRRFYGIRYDFAELLDYLTEDQPPGRMQWKAMFADKQKCLDLSNSFARHPRKYGGL
jgi:hypothetical protein